ncbi:hypothetical protein T11_17902, partial [Trichinella zimbabwensis]
LNPKHKRTGSSSSLLLFHSIWLYFIEDFLFLILLIHLLSMANIYGSNHSTDVAQSESSNATSLPGDVLTEIKNLLAALSVFVLAMTIVTLAALQLKFCIYRMKRNRRHKATQGYPNTSEPLKNMNISAISESVKSPKKINFLAKLDEFEILTPLTPNTAQTNFVALLPPTVPYNRSPGRITLFPLSCSLRRVNLNRIYCSPDRPDIVFSLYDSMKAFNGTTGGNEELDLISVDRTSYASVVDKNNLADNKRGTSELTEQCVVNEKKKSQHCADSDAYPSSISSITTDDDIPSLSKSSGREDSANVSFSATEYTSDKSLHNRLYQINKNNKTINNNSNNNNNNNNNINDSASSPSGSSMRDSISGADTTDSLSDNVFDEHEDLTKFNDGTSEVRVPSSGVSPFYGLRTKNTYSENNGNISTFDNFSLRLTNLDKIVEETESETDNSRPTYRMEEQIIPISLSHYDK